MALPLPPACTRLRQLERAIASLDEVATEMAGSDNFDEADVAAVTASMRALNAALQAFKTRAAEAKLLTADVCEVAANVERHRERMAKLAEWSSKGVFVEAPDLLSFFVDKHLTEGQQLQGRIEGLGAAYTGEPKRA
jgi:hypothetical protein